MTLFRLFVGVFSPSPSLSSKLVITVQLIPTPVINKPPTRSQVRVVAFLFHYFLVSILLPTFRYFWPESTMIAHFQWNDFVRIIIIIIIRIPEKSRPIVNMIKYKFRAAAMLIKTFSFPKRKKRPPSSSATTTTVYNNSRQKHRGWDKLRTWIAWAFDCVDLEQFSI